MNEERNRLSLLNTIRKWNQEEVKEFLGRNDLKEFASFADAKALDGLKLLNLSEGIVALWRPKLKVKKFMTIIKDLNENPHKHLNRKSSIGDVKKITTIFEKNTNLTTHGEMLPKKRHRKINSMEKHPNALNIEKKICDVDPNVIQVSRFTVKRVLEDEYVQMSPKVKVEIPEPTGNYTDMNISERKASRSLSFRNENDIFKNLKAPKSFLYSKSLENVVKKLHPYETMKSFNDIEFPSEDTITDRGYYEMMREFKARRHSDGSVTVSENPYEELCYKNPKFEDKKRPGILERVLKKPGKSPKTREEKPFVQKYKHLPELDLKINDFKIYSDCYSPVKEESHIEFAELVVKEAMDDVDLDLRNVLDNVFYEPYNTKLAVEEYLEPRVVPEKKGTVMDQILEEAAMNFYRQNVMKSKESNDKMDETDSTISNNNQDFSPSFSNYPEKIIPTIQPIPAPRKPRPIIPKMTTILSETDDKPFGNLQRWNENLKNRIELTRRNNMSDRPLPVPVENEFFYMEVSRQEAAALLEEHADGTFILRPSSQAIHAYTITLTYRGRIYNIGCRRRPDGRFALGFRKSNEQSFLTINDLIEHHYSEKLVLLVEGVQVGSTVLRKLTN